MSLPRSPAQDQRGFSWRYPAAVLGCAATLLSLFWLGLTGLKHAGLLPPPQLTNNFCADLKFEFLRTHRFDSPAVLAVGSSVTLMNFDGNAVVQATDGKAIPVNGAFCGLKMNQTAFTVEYFLARLPSIRDVLTIVAPEDLTECSLTRTNLFNPADVDDYVYHQRWAFPLYLAYFDPLALGRNVMNLRAMREGKGEWADFLAMDRFGDVPMLERESAPTLVYGPLPPLDPVCFAALRGLAQEVMAGGRRLVLVTTPLHPDWMERYDPDGKTTHELSDGIRGAIAGTNATFWDAKREFHVARADLWDAIHIRWPGVPGFSKALVAATGLGRLTSTIGFDRSNPAVDPGE